MITFRRLFRRPEAPASEPADPLDHPDLQRMTLRELADLPLPRPDGRPQPGAVGDGGARPLGEAA